MNIKWNPNCLNWPSWITGPLGAGLSRVLKNRYEKGQLPQQLEKYLDVKPKDFPTMRSTVMAQPGWCVVEADYQTAEMRGLGYIAGDHDLLRILQEPDTRFALVKPEFVPDGVDPGDCVCRLSFPDYIQLPEDKDKFLMTYSVNGEIKGRFTEDMLQVDENGVIKSPKHDIHWMCIEMARKAARETMDKKKDRGAGKVGNHSCPCV